MEIPWYEHALWQIYSTCIGPELSSVQIGDLHTTNECDVFAPFIVSFDNYRVLDPLSITYHYPLNSDREVAFWRTFLQPLSSRLDLKMALKARSYFHQDLQQGSFDFIDGTVTYWIQSLFYGPDAGNATHFLRSVFHSCQKDICQNSGFTGNPDIAGIGVRIQGIEVVL